MSWGIVAGAAIGAVGSAMSAGSAEDAADAQVASADRATEEQRRQYDLNRSDLAPFMKTGVAANKRLSYLLGTSENPDFANPAANQEVQRLAQNNARQRAMQQVAAGWGADPNNLPPAAMAEVDRLTQLSANDTNAAYSQVQAGWGNPAAGADYGSLLKKFSKDDLTNDPVYQSGLDFGLKQGTEGVNNRAIAGGSYDSGATLKALTRFANDYGSTKANESFNRYNIANDSIYNKLAGVSGAGQTATNQAVASGTSMANNIGGLMTDSGNARAAGIIGGANAWGDAAGAVSKGVNNYNTNQWLKGLTGGQSGGYRYTVPTYDGAEY